MKNFLAFIVLFLGCNRPEAVRKPEAIQVSLHESSGISLYPGYVAKSQGRIFWFPKKPTFNDDRWTGDSPVEITSCIADPWPYGPGDDSCILRTDF